jgi:glycosyltransferase 2 family protein
VAYCDFVQRAVDLLSVAGPWQELTELSQPVDEDLSIARAGRSRRAVIQRVLEILISLAFLALALQGINLKALGAALRQANYVWLLPAVLITLAILAVKGIRWQLLFHPEYHLPFAPVFTALCAGYLASNVLPARLGEVVRVVLLVSDEPVGVARTVSTIVVERLLDVLSVLIILILLLPFVELPPAVTHAAQALGILALGGSALLLLLSRWKERVLNWSRAVLRHIRILDRPTIYLAIGHLIDGFAALRGRLGLALIGLSLLSWFGSVGVAWCVSQAFGMAVPLSAMAFTVVVVALGMIVPSSPGYVGVFHYLVTVALAPFGVSKDTALSFALVWHGLNYVELSIVGLVALAIHGTSLGQVMQKWRERGRLATEDA